MKNKKKAVITGIGIVSACGLGKKNFFSLLKKGKSAISTITTFNTEGLGCKRAGEVRGFNLKKILKMKGLRQMSHSMEFALAASKLALDDASLKYPVSEDKSYSYGVSIGVSLGSIHDCLEFDRQVLVEGPRFVDPLIFANGSHNAIASQISIKFNIKGFNTTLSTSSTAGLDAISYACDMINNQGYGVVLAGSAEELTSEIFIGLIKAKCLASSTRNMGLEISCPYDRRRNGIIVAEGACVFVVEDIEHAKKRRAKPYAGIKGYGCSFDPKARQGFSIDAEAQAESVRQAITESGYPKDDIDCIIGSANSSVGCDYTESRVIKKVFKDKAKTIPVTSVKSMIGESFGASGSFNTAAAIYALENNLIPPTINYLYPDNRCDLNIVANKAAKKRLDNILINAFSYNGHNASLVIGRP